MLVDSLDRARLVSVGLLSHQLVEGISVRALTPYLTVPLVQLTAPFHAPSCIF